MLKLIKLFSLYLLQVSEDVFMCYKVLVVLMAILEIAGVASIIPFMTLVGNMNQLQENTFIAQIYQASGISSESQFVFFLGFAVLIMMFISALISIYTIWMISMFANKVGTEIADRLYNHYLKQNWLFHASGSSAQLTRKIAIETQG